MKKGITVRLAALFITLFMISTIFGCTIQTKEAESEKTTKFEETSEMSKTIEISWLVFIPAESITDGNPVQKAIEEKFNVKIKNVHVPSTDVDKFNVMVATGEMPDYFRPQSDVFTLYRNGIIRGISKDYFKQYSPSYYKFIDNHPGGWAMYREPGAPESHLALLGADDTTNGTYLLPYLRLDWVEKSPIKPKGTLEDLDGNGRMFLTKEAFTMDELEQILNYFANGDPDGNGKKDTYGLSFAGVENWSPVTLYGAFGIGKINFNYLIDNKLYYAHIVPMLKDYLKTMNRWYKMGILDPEFITDTLQKVWEKAGEGKIGYLNNSREYADYETPTRQNAYPGNILAKNSQAKILVTPPEIGVHQGEYKYRSFTNLAYPACISKSVDDEKLKRILMIYDWVNFDEEGYILARYGREGVDFTWSGERLKSSVVLTDPKGSPKLGTTFYSNSYYGELYEMMSYRPIVKNLVAYFKNGDGAKYANIDTYKIDLFNTTKWSDVYSQYSTTLETMYGEFFVKAITGEIDIDAEWDNYVNKWKSSGGDVWLQEINKMLSIKELLEIK